MSKPSKIYLFCCSSSFDPAELAQNSGKDEDELKIIPLPCSGKIDILYLTKAFETGADGVVVVTCRRGECRYLEGNLRAEKRAAIVDALLGESGLGAGRIIVIQLAEGGVEQVKREVTDFRNRLKALSGSVKSTGIKAVASSAA